MEFMKLKPGFTDPITELAPDEQFTASAIFTASNAMPIPMWGTVTAESEIMYRFEIEMDGIVRTLWAMRAMTQKGPKPERTF
ncbi:hypothetical protein ACSVHC_18125 [Arthrobacter sp. KNU-44]|uniref:hypothetical protein n=1 Tax=Arthrobacter sp. KNU-44 TaxID=3450744 RepID=UPI003F42CB98